MYVTCFLFVSFRYILGVESPLVCDILSTADEYGLVEVEAIAPRPTTTPPPAEETKNYVKFTAEDAVIPGKQNQADKENAKKSEEDFYDQIISKDDLADDYDDDDDLDEEEEEALGEP